jgi:hypothetical protein
MSARAPLLVVSRCFNHAGREASARCIGCGRHFCRECVAEHDGRMICGACLRREAEAKVAGSGRWPARVFLVARFSAALVVAWLVFYAAGRLLLQVPSEFHEGSVWRGEWWQGGK